MTTDAVPPFNAVWEVAERVDGWMTREQGRLLYEAARRCPPGGTVVEIGSCRGRSTIVLAAAADPTCRVVAVDPHAGNDRGPRELAGHDAAARDDAIAFRANLERAGLAGRVTHVRAPSRAAQGMIDGVVDVVHIDGAHRFGPARCDIVGWGERLPVGGVMLLHDAFSAVGVTAAIVRELLWGTPLRYAGRSRSMAVYRRGADDRRGRAANLARQLAQLPWFCRNVALKIALSAGVGRALGRLGRPEPEWPY